MEDVVDDFSTLGRVAARLGEWRTSDVDSYQSAYVSLVLHRWVLPSSSASQKIKYLFHGRIFSPIVRHHQLFWSPFTSTVAISEQPWFAQVIMRLSGYFATRYCTISACPLLSGPQGDFGRILRRPWQAFTFFHCREGSTSTFYLQYSQLLKLICEKVVMAKLVGIVRSGYDPVSTNQTNR